MTAAQARRLCREYARTDLGRHAAEAVDVVADPVTPDTFLVLMRDGSDEWAMLIEYGRITEDSIEAEDFYRNMEA